MTGNRAFRVLKAGLETSIQELPGRIGYWEQGIPPSGPVDFWSFRLANLLVGNHRDTAALECQFLGPALRFESAMRVAVTGADMGAKLDGEPIPMWRTVAVRAGQVLELGGARLGARTYVALAGGIATEPLLGSRAVFHMAGIGGRALKVEQIVLLGQSASAGDIYEVPALRRPPIGDESSRRVACVMGPNDDWLSQDSIDMFLSTPWVVQAKSNRTGMRLSGSTFEFAPKALKKRPEHGQDPSNILDHGYPLGAINLAGQTPIILLNDAPSTGGFINPFTVPSAEFWKLGQARFNERLNFHAISVESAQELRRELDKFVDAEVLVRIPSNSQGLSQS